MKYRKITEISKHKVSPFTTETKSKHSPEFEPPYDLNQLLLCVTVFANVL